MSKLFSFCCADPGEHVKCTYIKRLELYTQSIHEMMMMMILIEDMQSPSFPASNLLIFHSFFISYHSILPSSSLFIISGRQAHPSHQHVHALPSLFLLSSWKFSHFLPSSSLPRTLILSSSSRFPFHSHYMLAYTFFFLLLETSSTREKFV